MCRTFCIDPVPKVEKTYALLVALHEKCLKAMAAGRELKGVVERAHAFLAKSAPELVGCLPKTLGFSVGLDYREAALVLNGKNTLLFEARARGGAERGGGNRGSRLSLGRGVTRAR